MINLKIFVVMHAINCIFGFMDFMLFIIKFVKFKESYTVIYAANSYTYYY